jgi:hypothetical protein
MPVRIVRKCALRATTKRLMHGARSIVRSQAPQAPAAYGVSRGRTSAPHSRR